jgi:hypothetical protein
MAYFAGDSWDGPTTESQVSAGTTSLMVDLIRRLETRFPGLTTDWLSFGRTHGMSVETAEALGLTDVDAVLPMR